MENLYDLVDTNSGQIAEDRAKELFSKMPLHH
jgi:hypothetical protein